jgi:hypothetical protein
MIKNILGLSDNIDDLNKYLSFVNINSVSYIPKHSFFKDESIINDPNKLYILADYLYNNYVNEYSNYTFYSFIKLIYSNFFPVLG